MKGRGGRTTFFVGMKSFERNGIVEKDRFIMENRIMVAKQ